MKITTFVAGLRRAGMVAPMVLNGPINRDAFHAYAGQVLVPELSSGDFVVMDDLSSHKAPAVREMIEAAGARLLYLRPTAPSSPHRAGLLQAQGAPAQSRERTIHGLWDAIGRILDLYSPDASLKQQILDVLQ